MIDSLCFHGYERKVQVVEPLNSTNCEVCRQKDPPYTAKFEKSVLFSRKVLKNITFFTNCWPHRATFLTPIVKPCTDADRRFPTFRLNSQASISYQGRTCRQTIPRYSHQNRPQPHQPFTQHRHTRHAHLCTQRTRHFKFKIHPRIYAQAKILHDDL